MCILIVTKKCGLRFSLLFRVVSHAGLTGRSQELGVVAGSVDHRIVEQAAHVYFNSE